MITQEMLEELKAEYERQIRQKYSEIDYLTTKIDVVDDLARIAKYAEATETYEQQEAETETAQTEEIEENPVEEQETDGSY
jgi:hypothetical protein